MSPGKFHDQLQLGKNLIFGSVPVDLFERNDGITFARMGTEDV